MLSPTTSTNQKKIKNARCTKKIATSGRDPMTPVQTFLNIENVHATWVKFHHDTQTLHPLEPLVEAWQNRPRPAVRNKRTDRILPAGLGMIATPDRNAYYFLLPIQSLLTEESLPFSDRRRHSLKSMHVYVTRPA